jgi:cell division protein FtsB
MQHSPYRASGNFDAYGEPAPWDENGEYDEYEERGTRSIAERLRKARHDRRHRKADRAFSRDYAEEIPANEGPRAAVYRGKMGRQHQRAARMQSQGSRFTLKMPAFLAGIIQALSLDRIVFRPWFAVTAVTVFCVAIMATNVYPAAQDYYLQMRSNDQLAAEYQAILDRNAELEDHVAALQTDEGMEELAHESLGWVREGENSVSVLTDGSADPGTSSLAETESVVEGSVPAPETWYSPFLDAVFGYEG